MARRKKFPNNYGGVTELKGNRKNPYMAWIPEKKIKAGAILASQYEDVEDVSAFVNAKEFKNKQFEKDLKALIEEYTSADLIVTRKKIPIGYFPTYEDAANCLYERNKLKISIDVYNITFGAVWKIIESEVLKGLSETRIRAYEKAFKNCLPLQGKKMRSIKSTDIQQCVDTVAETAPTQQLPLISLCNAVFKYAMSQDVVSKNYTEFVAIRPYESKGKTPYTREELKLIKEADWCYEGTNKANKGFNVSRVIIILAYTGLRIAELLNLKAEDVHLDERYIEVHGTKTASANRITPIHKDIADLMKTDNEYIISNAKGVPLSYSSFFRMFTMCMKDLGMKHTIHETRHTFVSIATVSDVNPMLLKKMVGHSTSSVTENYTHAFIEDLIREIDKIKF